MEKVVRATELDVSAMGLVLPDGFRIESVDLAFPGPVVPCSPWQATEGTRVDLVIQVSAEDVASYLNSKQPSGLSGFRVSTKNGQLQVVATLKVAILPVEVGAEGILEFTDGKLNFVPKRAEVGGVGAPEGMVKDQLGKINPLIDLTGWPVDTVVRSIEIGNGKIRLEGTLTLTADIPRRDPK